MSYAFHVRDAVMLCSSVDVNVRIRTVIFEDHDLSDSSTNKACESFVYDFRNDVDTQIRSHNVIR
jgi:hypothetical protein